MKKIAWPLVLFLLVAGPVGVYLYLAVNEGHWGAWCGAPDSCSRAPELGGILLVSSLIGLAVVALVAGLSRVLRKGTRSPS